MNSSRLVLPHPLSCLEHATVYRAALAGSRWEGERFMHRFFAIMASLLLLCGIPSIWAVLVPDPAENRMSILVLSGFLIMLSTGLGGPLLFFSARNLRNLNRMPIRRMREEQDIVSDQFMAMNEQLAGYWDSWIKPRLDGFTLRTPEERALLQYAITELVRLDGLLYEIAQRETARHVRSRIALQLNLDHQIQDLHSRELPPIVDNMGL